MNIKKNIIVTHNRHFHTDELMAIVLLHVYFFNNEKYEIIRTRDEKVIKEHQDNKDSFVIDVGFTYDESNKCFDHHQIDFQLKWDNGTPLSSCGLIWKWLKDQKILHQKMNKEMMKIIENNLIILVDAHDNGIELWKEGYFLTIYNRKHDDENVMNKQFNRALGAAIDYYHNFLSSLKREINEEKEISKNLLKYKDEKYAVFPSLYKSAPVVTSDDPNKKLIIMPHSKGKWMIQSVPISRGQNFELRCPMPEHWRGLKDKDLVEVSEIDSLIFVHKSGFLAIMEGTIDDAIKLSKNIILYNEVC